MKLQESLDHGTLISLLEYDPLSGNFFRRSSNKKTAIGTKLNIGYLQIRILGVRHSAHRLAWLYMTGSWPISCIDHINRDRSDNRRCNLRECNYTENARNKAARGYSWVKKVSSWRAEIKIPDKIVYLGSFDNELDARAAYLRARKQYYGEFA